MKIKVLTVVGLAAFLFMVGCKSSTNSNMMTNANMMNSNMMNSNMMANSMMNTMAASDSVAATAVADAEKKAGFSDVTVTATTTEVTLRGTVPKGKLGEAVRVANETGKRKVNNELTEK